jgi:hypothetical protein
MVDIGYRETANAEGGRVIDTTLCALMLQVYYRYLPTFLSFSSRTSAALDPRRRSHARHVLSFRAH